MDAAPKPSRGATTRRELLASGARIFGKVGFVNADVAMVIADASRSRGTFYIYFQDKADLLRALIEDFRLDLRDVGFSQHVSFEGRAEDFLRVIWPVFKRHAATFRALVQAAAVDSRFDDLFREIRSYARRDFVTMISSNRTDPDAADIGLLASVLETMMMHCMYDWLAAHPETPMRPEEEQRAFETLSAVIANAVSGGLSIEPRERQPVA